MRDKGLIVIGLVVFLGLITFPISYNLRAGTSSKGPELKLPEKEKACVAPTEYMRTSHMDLLMTWRDEVVRENERTYKARDGKTYQKSLSGTCLSNCHTDKAEFCDRCHDYAGVKPYCWECHVDPRLIRRSEGAADEHR